MRLNKYLAQAGISSRRKADELIAGGHVQINGRQVTTPGEEVGPEDVVEVDGQAIEPIGQRVVYLLHKPSGAISTVSNTHGRRTVVDLIRDSRRLFPVGRLDRDTTGALLITNDGELANILTHPRYGIERRYIAEVRGRLSARAVSALATGLTIEGGMRVRAQVRRLRGRGQRTVYQLRMTEGKNREVKRIFKHFRLPLIRLHRRSFAGLTADNLPEGRYRRLSKHEIAALYKMVNMPESPQAS
ncbi:MAG: rRNA pseudouridine synthase [Fidelibacterota bacterium]|nr:MAG: rRNA pseudouridine synthase [Candidatus Neomarinimicrobiota bacterium]